MRVLFAVHHPLDERLGAPSVSLAIGAALAKLGHDVEYHGYDQAYPGREQFGSQHQLAYPWKLAAFLRRNAGRFDVLDVTTGDAHVWHGLGRPGGGAPALVTRSNGLEHLASQVVTQEARAGRLDLSWKYPIYHGGLRLREVRRSLRSADGVLLLTAEERTYATQVLGVNPARIMVVPHGIKDVFVAHEPVLRESPVDEPMHLCFIGNWYAGKGTATIAQVAEQLVLNRTPFDLLIAGSALPANEVLKSFSTDAAARVTVIPRYASSDLVGLLADRELLLCSSRFEGFGIAVLEAMACGVAPIATPVGLVPSVVVDGVNGIVVPHQRPDMISAFVQQLALDRAELLRLRTAARKTARLQTWESAARRTLTLYELARSRHGKRRSDARGGGR
jgi:glycosyltransferase involved in cell wall biosynthesis